MKKLSLYILAAAALVAMPSCSDEKTDAVIPTNPQLPLMTSSDLAVTPMLAPALDLTVLNNENTLIPVGQISKCENLPEGYELSFVGTLGREESFVHQADFEMTVEDDVIYVAPDVLEGAYINAIGKSAKTKDVYMRVAAYASKGKASVRLGGEDTYYFSSTVKVTPIDLGIVIEDAYGLLGTINGWSVADAVLFDHEGTDPYDNPVFTMVVNITDQQAADGWWWKIVPQSTIAAGNWVDEPNSQFGIATNGGHELEGNLIPWSEENTNPGAGCVNQAGVYVLTIDMENQTYEFVPQFDYLWTPGNSNGWNHLACQKLFGKIGGTVFEGFAIFDGEFKFTAQADWSGVNYGAGETEGTLSTDGGAGNLKADKNALYYAKVDTEKLTYVLTEITSVGLIGDFNNWGGDEVMTTADNKVYTGKITLGAGHAFKVRMNGGWDINLGGDVKKLTFGGDNVTAPAGTYTVTLDLTNVPYTLTLTK
ncbi:MAG: hypothetical protein K2K84_01340 [Muribaculaceae bacterium]|nr:hypothetical protein [Muribaculaceae bacterium]